MVILAYVIRYKERFVRYGVRDRKLIVYGNTTQHEIFENTKK